MPLDTLKWLDSLCPRLLELLQLRFQKEYLYNFDFASQATQNSIKMWNKERTEHFEPLILPATAEVIATVGVEKDDESTLVKLIDIWDRSEKHKKFLVENNSLGIGFAYDLIRNFLYATVRLGE